MNMHIQIEDKVKCTGCAACANVCSKKSINMEKDECGFWYPMVDKTTCINCGQCVKVCPVQQHVKCFSNPMVYAAWSKDERIREHSTSGGIFSELALCVLKKNGKVVGAAYSDDNMVEHVMIDQINDLYRLRQSKYVQSDCSNIYRVVEKVLITGEVVLFAGTPCQVAGMKSYLKKEYDNLYCVDFICRGVNSPKAYYWWLKGLEKKMGSKIVSVWFKHKKYGWKASPKCTKISYANGKEKIYDSDWNSYMRGYLEGNLYLRPSCGACVFKDVERSSDVTLADFWKIKQDLDDDKGTSMVMINSSKGINLFEEIKNNIIFEARQVDEVNEGNVCFGNSVKISEYSEEFLMRLGKVEFEKLLNMYLPLPFKRKVRRNLSKLKRYILFYRK